MVSTWRFWSGKEINFSRSHPFQMLVLVAIMVYVLMRYSNVVLFGIGADVYVLGDLGAGGVRVVAAAADAEAAAAAIAAGSSCTKRDARADEDALGDSLRSCNFHSIEGCLCTRLRLPEPLRFWAGS